MGNKKILNGLRRKEEGWFFICWRPAMAWQYITVCLFDFLIAPILIGIHSYIMGVPFPGWDPLTLKGGAVYHAAMGAVTGLTAWSRGNEKIAIIQSGFPFSGAQTVMQQSEQTDIRPAASTESQG